jgi:hypothetical protein
VVGRLGNGLETRCDFKSVAPIQSRHGDVRVMGPDDRIVAEGRHDPRPVPLPETRQGGKIQVVVVVMGDEHRIDAGQIVEPDTRRVVAPGAGEGHRAGALGPDRICDDVAPCHLDQEGGMSDQTDAQVARRRTRRRRVLEWAWVCFGPGGIALGEPPAQELAEAPGWGSARVEEALSVEVIAWRAVVVKPTLRGVSARRGAQKWQRSDQFCELSAG